MGHSDLIPMGWVLALDTVECHERLDNFPGESLSLISMAAEVVELAFSQSSMFFVNMFTRICERRFSVTK
jgi:hypothetical protein